MSARGEGQAQELMVGAMSDGRRGSQALEASRPVRTPRSKFVAARIYTLATLLRRATNIAANRELGLTQQQARFMILLIEHQPATISRLSDYSSMDASQFSRTVRSLVDVGYLDRKQKGRFAELKLTPAGEAVATKLVAAAAARNEHILSDFSAEERARLYGQLDVAIERATELLEAEWRLSQTQIAAE